MLGIAEMFAELDGYAQYEAALAVVANRKAVRVAALADGSIDWRHGLARYGLGCRCATCRAANKTYMREYQRQRAKDPAFRAKRREYDRKRREARRAA
jgi:hypothetical protein